MRKISIGLDKISANYLLINSGQTVALYDENVNFIATAVETPVGSSRYTATFTETPVYGYWYINGVQQLNTGKIWLGSVVGSQNLPGKFYVSGNLDVSGAFGVSQASTFTGKVNINSDATVTGNMSVTGSHNVGGNLEVGSNLVIDGAITANAGVLGGWNINTTQIFSNNTASQNNIIFDSRGFITTNATFTASGNSAYNGSDLLMYGSDGISDEVSTPVNGGNIYTYGGADAGGVISPPLKQNQYGDVFIGISGSKDNISGLRGNVYLSSIILDGKRYAPNQTIHFNGLTPQGVNAYASSQMFFTSSVGLLSASGSIPAQNLRTILDGDLSNNSDNNLYFMNDTDGAVSFNKRNGWVFMSIPQFSIGQRAWVPVAEVDYQGNIWTTSSFVQPSGSSLGYVLTSDASGKTHWSKVQVTSSVWLDDGTNVFTSASNINVSITGSISLSGSQNITSGTLQISTNGTIENARYTTITNANIVSSSQYFSAVNLNANVTGALLTIPLASSTTVGIKSYFTVRETDGQNTASFMELYGVGTNFSGVVTVLGKQINTVSLPATQNWSPSCSVNVSSTNVVINAWSNKAARITAYTVISTSM